MNAMQDQASVFNRISLHSVLCYEQYVWPSIGSNIGRYCSSPQNTIRPDATRQKVREGIINVLPSCILRTRVINLTFLLTFYNEKTSDRIRWA